MSLPPRVELPTIVIQARTGSTRLPRKMIRPFSGGESILTLLLKRIKKFCPMDVIVATTTNESDKAIIELAEQAGVTWFTGDEHNVLKRFLDVSERFCIKKIIRVCADNPFLDCISLNRLATGFNKSDVDYWAFFLSNGLPSIRSHYGFWSEGVTSSALKKVAETTSDRHFIEHVTPYIYENSSEFKIFREPVPAFLERYNNIRLTVDTEADFIMLQEIYANIAMDSEYPVLIPQVLSFLDSHPIYINRMAEQIILNTK